MQIGINFGGKHNMSETVRTMIPEDELDRRIRELGAKISEDYAGKHVFLACISFTKL